MNKILAAVKDIVSKDNLNIVRFDFNDGQTLSMMSLGVGTLKKDNVVNLSVKPSNIAIAKDFKGVVSYSNQLKATIKDLENGEILTSLMLDLGNEIVIESIITLNSSKRMDLKIGDEVTAFIKASELFILEVLDV